MKTKAVFCLQEEEEEEEDGRLGRAGGAREPGRGLGRAEHGGYPPPKSITLTKKPAHHGMEVEGCRQSKACGFAKCRGVTLPNHLFTPGTGVTIQKRENGKTKSLRMVWRRTGAGNPMHAAMPNA